MPADTRRRLLDATYELVAEVGLARLALEDVAGAAGVSRQTVYRHFGSREGLIEALVLREEQVFIQRVVNASAAVDTVEGAVAAGMTEALSAASEHPLLRRLLETEPGEILPLLVLGRGPVISAARPVVAGILTDRLPLEREEAERAADVCSRLMVSYVLDPGPDDATTLGRRIATLLVRGVV